MKPGLSYPPEGNAACFAVEDESFWFQHRNQCIVALLEAVPPPGTLFDVGGGNGVVAAALQRAGWEVVLVEPGRQGARNARRRGIESVVCARLEDLRIPAQSLPAIGLFDVLEHIQDDAAFLRTVASLLIPAGRLYLSVPASRALWSAEDREAGHYRRYTLRALRQRLTATGFQVEYASYFFWLLPFPILLLRTLPSLFGRSSSLRQTIRDHPERHTWLGRLLVSMLRPEVARIRSGRRMPMGSSCLVAASRKPA